MTSKTIELDTIPLDAIEDVEAETEGDGDDLGSIDRLMSETDHGWEVEEQVLTLQKAAADLPTLEISAQAPERATEPRGKAPPPLPASASRSPEPSVARSVPRNDPATFDCPPIRRR